MIRNIVLEPDRIIYQSTSGDISEGHLKRMQMEDKFTVLTRNTRYPSYLINLSGIFSLVLGAASLGLLGTAAVNGDWNKKQMVGLALTSLVCGGICSRVCHIDAAYQKALNAAEKSILDDSLATNPATVVASMNKYHGAFSESMNQGLKNGAHKYYPITSWLMSGKVNYILKEERN